MQLSTSWSYTQVPRQQQQQGASSEDDKEDKRRQETVRGLLSSSPSSRPLEHSTTEEPSISPKSFLLTSLLMTCKLVMQAFQDLSLELNKIELVYFSLDCGDGLGSSSKDGVCSLYSKMARTNLRLQGWHKIQHWRHCLTGMKHKEVDSLQCWQVQKCHFLFWCQTHSHSLQQQFKVEELLPHYQFISEWWMPLLDWRMGQLWIISNHKCNTQHRMWPFKMAPCQGTPEVISGWKRVFLLAFTSIMIVGRSWMVW